MPRTDPVVVAEIAGFGVFLWLGLYLMVRFVRPTAPIVASRVGLFSQAAFFGFGALTDTTLDARLLALLERASFWTTVVPVAAWFHFSNLIRRSVASAGGRRATIVFSPLDIIVYTAAGLMSLFGSISDLFVAVAPVDGAIVIGPGSAYSFYIVYVVFAATGACFNFWRALQISPNGQRESERALRRQLQLLASGALFFLIGAFWIAVRYNWHLPVSIIPGYVCLFAGLGAIGYGVALFGLLLDGQQVGRDFLYSFTGVSLLNLAYIGLLSLTGLLFAASLLALVGLVTLTHTTFDSGRKLLDRLFFSQAEQSARTEAREYATALGTTPVAPPLAVGVEAAESQVAEARQQAQAEVRAIEEHALKVFKDQVRKALTGLKSPPQLAQSPLLALELVERRLALAGLQDNRLNRVAALRELLIEQIEGLRPADGLSSRTGDAWRFYNVLYFPYVRELSRKGALAEARRLAEERRRQGQHEPQELEQVLGWLADVDEDTFYKWQRRASDTIAAILWEENQKLSSARE